uniref:AAA protein C-terminal winged helix domain-containing protein n=1 Tax=Phakopsora pachyrhizi TaxID=170000 RepID=A0A0S1MIU1_PHAPC
MMIPAGLLLQLQQRAESWSQAGIATIVFSSDDHWPYTTLRKNASRMSVLTVSDLNKEEAIRAIRAERKKLWRENRSVDDREVNEVWNMVGGRIGYLSWCMKHKDMIHAARAILEREKQWLLSRIGLIVDCDDDVMDEQKWSSSSFLLMQALVEQAEEQSKSDETASSESNYPRGVPYWQARQIMTRADFLSQLDHENMIAIDIDFNVRPNSIVLLNVIREICDDEGFKERLESVLERIGDIESLGRTRELIWKSGKDGDGVMNIKLER